LSSCVTMRTSCTPFSNNAGNAAPVQHRVHRRAAAITCPAVRNETSAQVAQAGFNFRAVVQASTRDLVAEFYPQLLDLVDSGRWDLVNVLDAS
jgi:hypothetical protein